METTLILTVAEWLTVIGGCLAALMTLLLVTGKLLLSQVERRLDTKFAAMEESRSHAAEQWRNSFSGLEHNAAATERRLTQLLIDLPLHYQRREDAIRQEVAIIHRLDALSDRIGTALRCDTAHCPVTASLQLPGTP